MKKRKENNKVLLGENITILVAPQVCSLYIFNFIPYYFYFNEVSSFTPSFAFYCPVLAIHSFMHFLQAFSLTAILPANANNQKPKKYFTKTIISCFWKVKRRFISYWCVIYICLTHKCQSRSHRKIGCFWASTKKLRTTNAFWFHIL